MTTKKIILTFIILLTVGTSVFAILAFNCCDDCKYEIKKKYSYDKVSGPESYESDCAIEFNNKIQFPIDKPTYAKLHFDQLTKPSVTLDSKQTELILAILNDSGSYIWGEIGTPHFDRHFSFHSKDGKCIGHTDLSFDGQTYSTPSLARMKWGALTKIACDSLKTIIHSVGQKSAREKPGRQE